MYRRRPILWMLSLFVLFAAHSGEASDAELSDALTVVRTASPTAATTDEVREAWRVLAAADVAELPTILRGMTNSNPAVENWLRAAADAVAARTLAAGGTLPTAPLIELLSDTDVSPRARRTAYEWIKNIDADQAYQLLATMTNDPSLEIRFDAIAAGLDAADSSGPNGLQKLQTLFRNARNLDQIKDIKARLVELGEVVDLPAHMGFITSWRMVGPFDNANRAGFDVAYPPESSIDFSATFDGKTEPVQWRAEPVTTDNELAEVDIASAFGPVKGAIVYAHAEFESPQAGAAQIRYSSKNATKLWLNGVLVAANEVYHAGDDLDQYVVDVELQRGANAILLKVCQNEQTEPWAQDWQFQLRVTDELGGAINRKPQPVE